MSQQDHNHGRFGAFGGRYVPEALWTPLERVDRAYLEAIDDPEFERRLKRWRQMRIGRPTPVTHLSRLSREVGGAQLWAKREDLCQEGMFCITSAVTQGLLADRMDKELLIGETATGDFGTALGSVGRALDLDVVVFMSRHDIEREPINVARMRRLGVDLVAVDSGGHGRSRSMAEAFRNYSINHDHAFYATSSLASPAPYPTIVGEALSVIGRESADQLQRRDIDPEYVVAPTGSGSFAAGLFAGFLDDGGPQLVGVQAGGEESTSRDAASLVRGRPGVYLGTRSLVLQDEEGQIEAPQAEAPGMVMPVSGPQHARWLQEGRVHYVTVEDSEAREARTKLLRTEGILASRETGYGLAYALKLAPTLPDDEHLVVGITGGGIRGLSLNEDEEDDEGDSS